MRLADKTVVITGGGRGIGRAIAERLGREGARVALLDVSAPDPDAARSGLEALGFAVRGYEVNVAVGDQVVTTMDRIVSDFGRLDVMVNNAGILQCRYRT